MQVNGEIAGHTCDVSSTVVLGVHVIKDLNIDGPILLPYYLLKKIYHI